MYNLLRITKDYAVSPESRAFALLGSTHHKMLEGFADGKGEVKVEVMGIQGTCDMPEEVSGTDECDILDYKTWGSFRVARALGLEDVGKVPDPSGAVYTRGGKWGPAGSPKMVSIFRANAGKADLANEVIQLNFYRVGLEKQGRKVRKLGIQATVRDGGTVTAKSYGVDRLIYMIEVPRIGDVDVMGWLLERKLELEDALISNSTRVCSDTECWGGRRCQNYCDVAGFCVMGKMVKELKA
jgi:hypothetical protein